MPFPSQSTVAPFRNRFTPRRLSALCLLLLPVVLAGCLGVVDASHLASAKRIGVLSVLGDKLNAETRGLTIFETRHYGAEAPDFKVDEAVGQAAVQTLRSANPRAQIVPLQAERPGVQLPDSDFPLLSLVPGPRARWTRGVQEAARHLAARHHLDLVVMILPFPTTREKSNPAPNTPGYGYFALNLFGLHGSDAQVYVNGALVTFDGATGQQLALRPVNKRRQVEGVKWLGSLAAYPEAGRSALALNTQQMIADEVERQLRHSGLIP